MEMFIDKVHVDSVQ